MLTNVNILEFLSFLSCVQHYRHIETQSNHSVTGAYITNQITNGGVRQQWFSCTAPPLWNQLLFSYSVTVSPRGMQCPGLL